MTIEVWGFVLSLIGCLIVGGIPGFFIARYFLKKQLDKNPPINEDMIRVMYREMGRKPSEAQIKAVMNNINKANKKSK